MKRIGTQLNETQYKLLLKKLERNGETPYARLKKLVLEFLYDKNAVLTFPFLAVCYSLTITSLVLLF